MFVIGLRREASPLGLIVVTVLNYSAHRYNSEGEGGNTHLDPTRMSIRQLDNWQGYQPKPFR